MQGFFVGRSKNDDIRIRKVDKTHKKVRVSGEKGSAHNKLRYELYTHAYNRLAEANEQAMYFEIIALCDMLITDRCEAYTQYLLHNDEVEYPTESIGLSVAFMGTAVKDKAPNVYESDEYKALYQQLLEFAKMRNEVLHGFILVKNVANDVSLQERLDWAEHSAEFGNKLVRVWASWVDKQIKI